MDLWALSDLCTPWCLHVVATLRVADHIAAGKTAIGDLAQAAGADRDALQRVLRHLAGKGVFEEPAPGRFALNEAARGLLEPGARLSLDLDGFGGRDYWDDLDANPRIAAEFDELMGPSGHGVPDPEVLLNPADWSGVQTVVDVGGGTGALLAEVLRARPAVQGILVDLPRTVAGSAEVFAAAGVSARATAAGQSFFDPLPPGGDVYMIKNVLGDWADAEAAALLSRCAEAARPSGRVVMLGGVNPGEKASPELLMLVLVSGKDRTLGEFRDLARGAGLEVTATGRQPSGRFVVECRPV